MKNKIKTCMTLALASLLTVCCLASCGGGGSEGSTEKPSNAASDIVDDVKDDIKDGAEDVKNGIEDILPDTERGDQTGRNGDEFTADENYGMGHSHRGGK